MSIVISRNYEGLPVTFNSDIWANATEMGKRFGKRPLHFLQLDATKEWISAYEAMTVKPSSVGSLVRTIKGGDAVSKLKIEQGTWMHPLLAVEYARWLSPRFAIWTNMVILDLMQGGAVLAPAKQAAVIQVTIEERYWRALNLHLWLNEHPNVGCRLVVQSVSGSPTQFAEFLAKKLRQPVSAEWMGRALQTYVRTLPTIRYERHQRHSFYTITRPVAVAGRGLG
jgi:hypothetical protein